jgi:hypothetical protein
MLKLTIHYQDYYCPQKNQLVVLFVCLFNDAGSMGGIKIMDMKWEEYRQTP